MKPSLDYAFAALAHPIRREILGRLAESSARATDLVRPFGITQQAISKHLTVLMRAGLVRQQKRGEEQWCALDSRPLVEATGWIETHRKVWGSRLDWLAELVEEP